MRNRLIFVSHLETETARFGAALEQALPNGATVALCGDLGAGKTRLVQAIAEAAGVDRRDVLSPTFVLVQEYHGRRTIHHIDAYRIADDDEFLALGPEEFFESEGLVLIEWADRVENCLPRDRLEIRIEVAGPMARRFEISATGQKLSAVLPELQRLLARGVDSPMEGTTDEHR
jgi:tRNA threonylcarbamoyladenosine biosynthesis protein TsaE